MPWASKELAAWPNSIQALVDDAQLERIAEPNRAAVLLERARRLERVQRR